MEGSQQAYQNRGISYHLTSLTNGEQQRLDATRMQVWEEKSAFFHGNGVVVAVLVWVVDI
jgi:hypothetical protein